ERALDIDQHVVVARKREATVQTGEARRALARTRYAGDEHTPVVIPHGSGVDQLKLIASCPSLDDVLERCRPLVPGNIARVREVMKRPLARPIDDTQGAVRSGHHEPAVLSVISGAGIASVQHAGRQPERRHARGRSIPYTYGEVGGPLVRLDEVIERRRGHTNESRTRELQPNRAISEEQFALDDTNLGGGRVEVGAKLADGIEQAGRPGRSDLLG